MLDTIAKEKTATGYIPYTKPYGDNAIGTIDNDIVQTIRLRGVPVQTLDNGDINGMTRQWFATINSLAAKNGKVALWTNLRRKQIEYDLSRIEYDNWFSQQLGNAYAKRLVGKKFYIMELYISVVLRTAPGRAEKAADKLVNTVEARRALVEAGMAELNSVVKQLMNSLRRYHPTLLGSAELDDGTLVSEQARYFSRLLNGGESGPINVKESSVRYAIQRNDLDFGREIIEISSPTGSRFVGLLGIKAPYGVGEIKVNSKLLHGLYTVPCEFDLSQSLTFLPVAKALKVLNTHIGQMGSAEGNAIARKDLETLKEELQAGRYGICEHEFILTIYGNSIAEVNAGIAEAIAALEAKALGVIRLRRGMLIAQFFGRLPGNFLTGRLRATPITTDNVSAFFPMHNFFTGDPQGGQWGMPLAMFEGVSGEPIFMKYQVSRQSLANQGLKLEYVDPADMDDDGEEKVMRKDSGNYEMVGANGAGKTVIQCLLRALTRSIGRPGKRPYKSFAFDADCGQETFINALGGRYFRFEVGEPTGIAPFSFTDTPGNRQFQIALAQWCAKQDETYVASAEDEIHLQKSIANVYSLPPALRRWARLRDTLPKGKSTLHTALGRWVDGGNMAWVLDGGEDRLNFDGANDFGFDMTSFLNVPHARTPILMCITHMIDQSAGGSLHSIDIDEAATALKDPYMQAFIEQKARRIRKKDGVIGLSVQNAADITSGVLSATLLGQFPTMFVFPNASAVRADYGFLSDTEFALVQTGMLDKPGKFLFKQGHESTVVCADLTGMNNMLAVLSGSQDNTEIARELMAQLGHDPKVWVPEFFQRRT